MERPSRLRSTSDTPCGSNCPVLDLQPRNTFELAFVVRDQGQARRLGMRGNPQIVVADHFALALDSWADCCIELAGLKRKLHDGQQTGHLGQLPGGMIAKPALFHSIDELTVGDHRQNDLARLQSLKSRQDSGRSSPSDVNANVRVE